MWIHSSDNKEAFAINFGRATLVLIPIFCFGGSFILEYSFENTPDLIRVALPLINDVAHIFFAKQPDIDVVCMFNKLDNAIINGTLPTFGENVNNALLGLGTMLGIGSNIVSTSWAALGYIFASNIIGGITMFAIVVYLNRVINELYSQTMTDVWSTVRKREPNMATRDFTYINLYNTLELSKFREKIRKNLKVREYVFQATEPMAISAFTVFGGFMLVTIIFCAFMTSLLSSGIFETDFHNVLEYVLTIDNKVFIGTAFWQQMGIVLAIPCQILYVLSIFLLGEFVVIRLGEFFGLGWKNDPHLFLCDWVLFSLTSESSIVLEKWDDHGGPDMKVVNHLREQYKLEYK